MAEVTSTIMAACIPFYRPLVRRVAGSHKGIRPSQESYGLANRSSKHNKLGSRAEVKGGFHEASDDSSDKGIMGHESSQIVRHTNIRVEYDEASNYPAGGGGDVEAGQRASPSYYWGNHAR